MAAADPLAQSMPACPEGAPAWPSALSREPRIAMWRAPADLAAFVTGLHLYVVDDNGGAPNIGVFEPSFAALRIAVVGGDEWRVRWGSGPWAQTGPVSLFGPTSRVVHSASAAGILLNGGLRPRGWMRLFGDPASAWADRIGEVPHKPGAMLANFRQRLDGIERDDAVPEAYFSAIRAMLGPPSPEEGDIAAIEEALVDPAVQSVARLCAITGLSIRRLQRLSNRAFGFPPKVLLRRARFLRSLNALRSVRRGEGALVIDPAYTDYSHFVRDAHDFLGSSPQAFVEQESPLLRKSIAMRTEVIGAPNQALDQVRD